MLFELFFPLFSCNLDSLSLCYFFFLFLHAFCQFFHCKSVWLFQFYFCFDVMFSLFAVFSFVLYKFVFKVFCGFIRLDDSGTVVLELDLFVNARAFKLYIHVLLSVVLQNLIVMNRSSHYFNIFFSQTKT